MKTCFVIQKFDGDIYDRRYRETFAPAIQKGGASPVRADEVLGTRPVVEKIEKGLHDANVAFAEISENNPNVFLELGYALALGVPTVIVCDKGRRAALPFDIAHRPVIFYETSAQSDYLKVAQEVEKGISAALLEERVRSSSTQSREDRPNNIDEVKGACLLALLDQSLRSPTGSALWEIQKEVAQSGVTERMASLAIASLLNQGLVHRHENADRDGDYLSFTLSEQGHKHLLRSYSQFMHQEREKAVATGSWDGTKSTVKLGFDADDFPDDIPF